MNHLIKDTWLVYIELIVPPFLTMIGNEVLDTIEISEWLLPFLRCCSRTKVPERCYKIPDPINSTSFKQMSNQVRVNESIKSIVCTSLKWDALLV